jgi:hypothetical protein
VAWLAVRCSKSAVAELMRVAWRTVGRIIERVVADTARRADLLAGLQRIGIDEISHRRGQRYITVVIDHDTGRLVWAARAWDRKTVLAFLDQLGQERAQSIRLVSADMAAWIAGPAHYHGSTGAARAAQQVRRLASTGLSASVRADDENSIPRLGPLAHQAVWLALEAFLGRQMARSSRNSSLPPSHIQEECCVAVGQSRKPSRSDPLGSASLIIDRNRSASGVG